MSALAKLALPFALLAISSVASADPWKDESGHGRYKDKHDKREHKEAYWDGNCKVERKYEKHGGYKEERKCKPGRRQVSQDHRYREPAQPDYRYRQPVVEEHVYYPPQPVYERREPAVEVDVRIRQ